VAWRRARWLGGRAPGNLNPRRITRTSEA
jgi:hypothetical protein